MTHLFTVLVSTRVYTMRPPFRYPVFLFLFWSQTPSQSSDDVSKSPLLYTQIHPTSVGPASPFTRLNLS